MKIQTWKIPAMKPRTLQPLWLQGETLDEVSRALPAGAYTTFRTFSHNKVLRLSSHLARIDESAILVGFPVLQDWEQIRMGIREAIAGYDTEGDIRIRLTLDLTQNMGDIYLCLEKLHCPSESDYLNGVAVVLRCLHRENAKAKLTRFIEIASEIRSTLPDGIHEAVMVDDKGEILEGLSSNFFAYYQGALWTREEGVLAGITRMLVLDEVRRSEIPIRMEGVKAERVGFLEEAFITSTSRGVLPVVQVDGIVIGDGKPGAKTSQIRELYQRRVLEELEEI